jgi:uncharacterized membrane protein
LLLTLLGLAAFFLTVSLPLALSREWLTVCWAVQAFLMLWIGGKLDSQFLRLCAYVVYVMVLWRVAFLDFGRAFRRLDGTLPPAVYWRSFVDRLVAFGVPVLSLGGAYRLLLRPGPAGPAPVCRAADIRAVLPRGPAFRLFLVLAVALGFVYLHFELNRMFLCLWEPLRLPVLSGLWIALAVGLALVLAQTPAPALNLALAAVAAGVLLKLLVVDLQYWQLDVHRLLYTAPHSWVQVAMRTLDFGVIIAFLLLFPRFAGTAAEAQAMAPVFAGLALALLFLYSTLELQTYLAIFRPGFRAGAVSILWTVFALAFVVRGIARNRRALRYVGLLLFAVVVWKVFFVDLARLDPIYRIVSFIVLGILVLCGSLIYLKYRDKFVIGTGAANQETPHP